MRILAIETSCDDTGIAILESNGSKSPDFKVLSNIVSSQTIHQNYGGVFPMMAKREHQNNLVSVLAQALKQSNLLNLKSKIQISNQIQSSKYKTIGKILEREAELLKQLMPFLGKYDKPDVDLIVVTNGPGLEPCLWVGVNFAKALSYFWNIPIIPVNHLESHILANFLNPKSYAISLEMFPAVCLVVSGGHTQIILMKGIGKYKVIGETRDDAAGECFDKCAKILGLGYPGGQIISDIAAMTNNPSRHIKLPRPMINSNDYDFSFSGLKTAVLYATKDKKLTKEYVAEMCVEIQQAIIDVLVKKTIKATKDFRVKSIIIGGGVSANDELRRIFSHKLSTMNHQLNFLVPPKNLSTDNALMIAVAGYFHRNKKTKNWKKIKAEANLRISK